MTTCPRTGKLRLTRVEAMAKAEWWRRSRFSRMRHYRCHSCGAWHIGNDRRKRQGRRSN